ncbi:hypothetical protein [Arthrobacter sp. efr-133-TYG-120]|uniref:hypothetical protein n=1 Tax=Arthrobacter sp. efr-133-TYG-120 TaxID=3040280 RepID=UPI00254B7A86|nr:hypothetical protein [Arthrobacter sp. efr-133-TYG-120]
MVQIADGAGDDHDGGGVAAGLSLRCLAMISFVPGDEHGDDEEPGGRDSVDDRTEDQQPDGVGGEEADDDAAEVPTPRNS